MNNMDVISNNNMEMFSSCNRWAGILVQEFELTRGTLPEAQLETHHITVNLGVLGTAEHKVNGLWRKTTYPTRAIGFVPAGQLHEPRWNFNSRIVTLSIDAQILPGLNFKEQRGVLDNEITGIAAILAAELRYGDQSSKLLGESSSITLHSLLQQKYGSGPHYKKLVYTKLSGSQLARVTEYCICCIDENISLGKLAGLCNLSPFHFARQFKKTTGQSPYQFLSKLRIDRAKQSLVSCDKPLNEIAFKLGYADQAHFSRAFKCATSLTPSEYRAHMSRYKPFY